MPQIVVQPRATFQNSQSARPKATFIGDSHLVAMQRAADKGLLPGVECKFLSIGGATAIGMRNPNSQTNAMARFRSELIPMAENQAVVLHLGEVDCGFVIWYRAEKYGEAVEAQLQESIAALFAFVDDLLAAGYRRVIVSAADLPTLRGGESWGQVANLRKEVKATLIQRTELTLRYNRELALASHARGLAYVDISEDVLNPETRLVDDRFRHPDPLDHHLNPDLIAPLWAARLFPLLV